MYNNLIKAHQTQTNAYSGLCMTARWGKTANDRHREVTTAFFSLPVMQSIRFLLALVENDIIRKRTWNCFHVAYPKLSACQSRPLPALFHTIKCMHDVEKGDRKFKVLFLWFLLSVYSQAKMEAQGVSGARTGLPDMFHPLLTRYLNRTGRILPRCLLPQAFQARQNPLCSSVPRKRWLCGATGALSYASCGLHCGSSGCLHCLWDILPPFPPSNKDSD